MIVLWVLALLVPLGTLPCAAGLERLEHSRNIGCSKALTRCTVSDVDSVALPDDYGPVEVTGLDAAAALCCNQSRGCATCIQVRIHLYTLHNGGGAAEEGASGDPDDEDEAGLTVRCFFGPNAWYMRVTFGVVAASPADKKEGAARVVEVTLVEHQNAFLGSSVNISVQSMHTVVEFPLEEVCHDADLAECKSPRIEIGEMGERNVVLRLKTYSQEENPADPVMMCTNHQSNGPCTDLRNWTLPLHTITPCMCFQVWRLSSMHRSEACLFKNHTEFRKNVISNLSLTVRHFENNEGLPALRWNLSAPCRVPAELWLCRLDGVGCKEVPGFRTRSSTRIMWKENGTMLSISGTFDNIHSRDPLHHCVMLGHGLNMVTTRNLISTPLNTSELQYKLDGKTFGPVCQHETSRWRWSRIGLSVMLVLCLAAVGAFLLWRGITAWISKSDSTHHSQGRCGTALLIHSSGSDSSQSDLVIRFAELLSELGVSVSLDLRDQKTVGAMGPTQWLHSQLKQIHKNGGKMLLLLSYDALRRTKECWESWNAQTTTKMVKGEGSKVGSQWTSDVFGSALNLIVQAHLKGGADERFTLVQFDSKKLDLPEPLQGLRLYKVPSDSSDLLADLQGRRQKNIGPRIKRFFWMCRVSARLQKGLIDYEEQRSATKSTSTEVKLPTLERNHEEEEIIPLRTEP